MTSADYLRLGRTRHGHLASMLLFMWVRRWLADRPLEILRRSRRRASYSAPMQAERWHLAEPQTDQRLEVAVIGYREPKGNQRRTFRLSADVLILFKTTSNSTACLSLSPLSPARTASEARHSHEANLFRRNTFFHESVTSSHQKTKTPIAISVPRVSSIFITRNVELMCGQNCSRGQCADQQ